MRTRDWRRYQRTKTIARVEQWLYDWEFHTYEPDERRETARERARKRHQQPAQCSCWMCGNPRKWLGERTMQERRAPTRDDD